MTVPRPQRLQELFDRAVDLDPGERTSLLARECADDPGLRSELLELLSADAGPAAVALESALASSAGSLPRAGTLLAGRYRIVQQIGEGGMGVVFAAEQQEPRRRVAVKCIRPGALDPTSMVRFRREAEALGRLQHPGIAQVFEAGVHEGPPAQPFLAMEFVDGRPLVEAARGLPLRTQLTLLAELAEAIAHAHERGVVHRDLKPSNVLVESGSAGPRPRVLDFGIARLDGDAGATAFTRTHQVIGTLAYMSPEQLQHGSAAADPRSDVWSLGVIAYELLAGVSPLPLREASLAEAARLLRDQEPEPLERRVPALRGDAATIVHKALAKDPARRYADAGALAADLRRLLADQPIAARPPSAMYQAVRFARRHRGLVGGLAATLVVLVAGLVVAVVLAAQATAARDRATARTTELRAMLRTLLAEVDRELAAVPGAIGARRTLLRAGQQHAEGMAQEALQQGDDTALLLEVAGLFEVLADVQGQPGQANLGDLEGALASLGRALQLVDRAIVAEPRGLVARRARVRLFSQQDGVLRALGRRDDRERALQAQHEEAERLFALAADAESERDLVLAGANRARFLAEAGRLAEALPGMVRARDFLRADWQRTGDRDHLHSVCNLDLHIGSLQRRLGDVPAARAAYADAVALARDEQTRHGDRDAARSLAVMLREEGTFHLRVDAPEVARERLEEARALLQPLVAAEPLDLDGQKVLRTTQSALADALLRTGRLEEARVVAEATLAALVALVDAQPGNRSLQRDLLPTRHLLVRIAARAGDAATAVREAAAALAQARATAAAEPGSAQAAEDVLSSLGMASGAAESSAQVPGLDADERVLRRAGWLHALQEQLAFAQQMEQSGRLTPERRGMIGEVQARIEALRANHESPGK